MSYTQCGSCPMCGAPIFMPMFWYGIYPPSPHYTCGCVASNGKIITAVTTNTITITEDQAKKYWTE